MRPRAGSLTVPDAAGSGPERDTMRVRVYRALARGLMAGMFKPGEAVTLRTLTSAALVVAAVALIITHRERPGTPLTAGTASPPVAEEECPVLPLD